MTRGSRSNNALQSDVRWVLGIVCSACVTGPPPAWAQPTAVDPEPSAAYQDKLISTEALDKTTSTAAEPPYNANGWARGWRVETFASVFDQDGQRRREQGLVFGGQIDTPNYGAISLDATARIDPDAGVFTLRQRGLPFDNGWLANNSVGMLNTATIDLSRNQYRFALPTFPIVGATSEWLRRDAIQIQASAGQPGVHNGLRLAGFDRLKGRVATVGAQWALNPRWQTGFQLADADNVDTTTSGFPGTTQSVRSAYGAFAWEQSDSRVQANLLTSQEETQSHPRVGFWLDGSTRKNRYRHNYGVFRLERDLSWGYMPVASDLQGAYYRVGYRDLRWIWDTGIDVVDSISGNGVLGILATGSARYQLNRAFGSGGGATVRRADPNEWAGFAFLDYQRGDATTRLQFDIAGRTGGQRGTQLQLEHTWPLPVGTRLSTSLLVSNETAASSGNIRRAGISILGGGDITEKFSIDSNLRWDKSSGGARSTSRYADVSLSWRISPRWSLSGTYYDNRNEGSTFLTVDPLIPVSPAGFVTRNRALFIGLRYEGHAGKSTAPLGGSARSGAGAVSGQVFLDANNDNRRGARENGAANVTVLLDGRFATQTDTNGKFSFPFVAAGTHVITVVSDNLPLPWLIENDGRRNIVVQTRGATEVSIAATKQ